MSESAPAPSAGNFLSTLAKRKVFGIPVMVFLLIGAATLLYFAIRMRGTTEGEEEEVEGAPEDGDFDGDISEAGGTPIFIAHPPPLDDDEPPEPAEPPDNEDWARDAITWLVKEGHGNYQQATSAITRYLDGASVSQAERELINLAIGQFGPPPDGYVNNPTRPPKDDPNPPGNGGPPIKQGNPPTIHTVRGKRDNNPGELTVLYYGRKDLQAMRFLTAVNLPMAPPYKRGDKVKIPLYRGPKFFTSTRRVNTLVEIARKNSTTVPKIKALNPQLKFPVKAGTKVRVE